MNDVNAIRVALQCGRPGCECARLRGNRHCPVIGHGKGRGDVGPSLSVNEATDGKTLITCHAGCASDAVIGELKLRGLWSASPTSAGHRRGEEGDIPPPKHLEHGTARVNGVKTNSDQARNSGSTLSFTSGISGTPQGLTLESLAEAKKLPVAFLKALGLKSIKLDGKDVVRIPYFNERGEEAASRFRFALNGEERFKWKTGSRVMPYGLQRLALARHVGWILLEEGESDWWTCWHYGRPALGFPGKDNWRSEWAGYLDGLTVYIWQEPGAEDFVERIGKDLPNAFVIVAPEGIKDISEAHLQGKDVAKFLEELKTSAAPLSRLLAERRSAAMAEAALQAHAAFASPDVLSLLEKSAQRMGYGGDTKPLKQVYLGMTTRLLELRKSQMPAHTLVEGPSSAGKTYTVGMACRHLPEEAVHIIEAGSPRALIYDDVDLSHKAVVFAEADNIPHGEDNPASSAIRGMLQDGYLHYDVVVRDEKTSEFVTKHIRKPGPTVLITTSTRSLGKQMMTRLFTVEVSTEPEQVRAALRAQAQADEAAQGPDEALVALQMYLQLGAPWRVVVPFAGWLAENVTADDPRVLRDFSRLQALIKAHALLHLRKRPPDKDGRIVASVDDYAAVFALVKNSYEVSASKGADTTVRKVVNLVGALRAEKGEDAVIRQADLRAKSASIKKATLSRAVNKALRQGWLVDFNNRHGRRTGPMDLAVGEALPDFYTLPGPDALRQAAQVPLRGTQGGTQNGTRQSGTNRPETGTEMESAQARVPSSIENGGDKYTPPTTGETDVEEV